MDRKDFLKLLWIRLFRPIVFLAVAYYCILFLVTVIYENGTERLLTIVILSLTLLFSVAHITGELLSKIRNRVYSKLSENAQSKWRIAAKICDYIVLLTLGALLYKLWAKDAILASILLITLLAHRINNLFKEENSIATQ